ncbi:hypothetical protein QEZ54_14610 [Catellatospora sp. KI3]|uniref:hypothetical protein n=1 Tax=Catellatospora sp. KI3 TaxID=3041620 RepID=UPI00248221A6|nr:hypothetical protein [Catellatospora sp. KI3]MDI1462198.1 hypothetical protein [Catellatospora sp. KI3]
MTDDMIARVALAAFVLAIALRGWLVARARPRALAAAQLPYDDHQHGTRAVPSSAEHHRPHRWSGARARQRRSGRCQPGTGRWLVRAAGVA